MTISSIQSTLDVARLQKTTNNPATLATKTTANSQYIKTSLDPTVSVKNQPMKLVFQAAITKLNEQLEPVLGPETLQNSLDQGLDVSTEATAERIVTHATEFFTAFKQRYDGESEEEVMEKFMQTIGRGIEQGFAEAKEILHGLGVLQGGIASNVDKTYELVQQGLIEFKDRTLGEKA